MVDEAGGRDHFEWQYRLMMPDHSIKYLHAFADATRDHNGELEYIAAVQDVTARRLAEEALDKARAQLTHIARSTSLGVLTASIAHELNQPLFGIITNATTCLRMLAGDSPDIERARETARRTIRDGNPASEVITRLRAMFTNEESAIEPLDLNEATREVVALLSGDLQRNRVILREELADDLPPIVGDRVQLQQVILNLLLNASDAMGDVDDRPRQLMVSTARDDDDRVRVVVQDAGVGFAPETGDKLFESLLHDQTERHWDRTVRQPVHGRKASWTHLGDRERRTRCDLFILDSGPLGAHPGGAPMMGVLCGPANAGFGC